jgi:hypothetical protein
MCVKHRVIVAIGDRQALDESTNRGLRPLPPIGHEPIGVRELPALQRDAGAGDAPVMLPERRLADEPDPSLALGKWLISEPAMPEQAAIDGYDAALGHR